MMLLGMMANTTRLENALDDVQGEISSIGDEVGDPGGRGDMHEGLGLMSKLLVSSSTKRV